MTISRLVVVIPCHRRWDLLPRAIEAVAPTPVIVVDDSPPELSPPHPVGTTVVQTTGSVGFASAANAGLRAAQQQGASHVLLLNDDAAPAPGCVETLCAAWGPTVGAVGPVLVSQDGRLESAGAELRWWGRVRMLGKAPSRTVPVDALSGACIMLPATVRFDEAFVHGFEDLSLCRSLRRRGQQVLLVGDARCVHHGGGTLDRRSRAAQRHAVSGHLRLLEHRRFLPVVVGLALGQVAREGGPPARVLGVAEGVRDWWLLRRR